jgi:HEPN superfamily AbiU2-like protein
VLGRRFHALNIECMALHVKWDEFVGLFGTKRRVDLLNGAGGALIRLIEDALFHEIVLHIWRMTDPNRKSLSLHKLLKHDESEFEEKTLKPLLEAIAEPCKFADDWRHRWIAHRNLKLAIQPGNSKPIERATKQSIDAAIDSITQFMKVVERHYCNGVSTAYEHSSFGLADSFLYVIRDGLEARDERMNAFERGELHDVRPRPIDE